MFKSKGNGIRHKRIFRDNFHGINKKQTQKAIGYTFDNTTWYDFCEYLEDCVRIDIEDMLVESVKTNNIKLFDQYIANNGINSNGLICSVSLAYRIVYEIIQDHVDKIRIPSYIRCTFRIIFEHLIIKYAKEYIIEMQLV